MSENSRKPLNISEKAVETVVNYAKDKIAQLQHLSECALEINVREDYVCLDRLDGQGNASQWARIALYDRKGQDCTLMLYDKEWSVFFSGSYRACFKELDTVIAAALDDTLKSGESVQVEEVNTETDCGTIEGSELSQTDKDATHKSLSPIIRVFPKEEIKTVQVLVDGEKAKIPTEESLRLMELTSVEEYDGIFYKREDLYSPFDDVPLSGGKVRQACSLILNNYEHIRDNCDGLLATPCSPISQQGVIVARAAKEFGFRSLILYGGSSGESIKKHHLAMYAIHLGAEIDLSTKMGFDSAIEAHLENRMRNGLKCFNANFGANLTKNPDAMIKVIGHQVQNIPDDLDLLVIPCGSCVTACGIMWGLKHYNKKVGKTYLIQIAGHHRDKTIKEVEAAIQISFDYEFIPDKTYAYKKHVAPKFGGGVFDPIYEGKAYEYMLKHLDIKDKKVLFWIVGNSQALRDRAKKTQYDKVIINEYCQSEDEKIFVDNKVDKSIELSETNKDNILRTIEKLERFPQLKEQTAKIEIKGNHVDLKKKKASGKTAKWIRITVNDDECSDCELVMYSDGKKVSFSTKGSLVQCLETANAACYAS